MHFHVDANSRLELKPRTTELLYEKARKNSFSGETKDAPDDILFVKRPTAGFLLTYCTFYAAGAAMISMWSCLTLTLDFFRAKYPLNRVTFVFPVINMSTLLLVSIYMILAGRQASIKLRMHGSLMSYAIFSAMILFVNLIHIHQNTAYVWTILALVCSTISSSVLQSSVSGLAGVFGPTFMQAIDGGRGFGAIVLFISSVSGLAGVFGPTFMQAIDGGRGFGAIVLFIVRFVVMWLLSDDQERSSKIAMIATFSIAFVLILLTWVLYAFLNMVSFARPLLEEFLLLHEASPAETLFSPLPSPLRVHTLAEVLSYDEGSRSERRLLVPKQAKTTHFVAEGYVRHNANATSLFGVLCTAYKPFLSVTLSNLICLSCFPGIIVAIPLKNLDLYGCFSVILVGCFNIGDLVGKSLPVHWMVLSVDMLHWSWILQSGFLLFFLFDYLSPVNDLITIMMVLGFGLTSGYVATCSNMLAPTLCSDSQKEIAGMVGALCSIVGLCLGSYCGLALITILQLIQLLRTA
ncbi:hypothetical protein ABG067_002220 [Albugo candida]